MMKSDPTDNSRIKLLGVINITPNSFSDGGKYFDSTLIKEKIQNDQKLGFRCLDFGAESTATKNKNTVNQSLEIERLKSLFLPLIKELKDLEVISLDTYRFETFLFLYKELRIHYPNKIIFWNDVSGVIDPELEKFFDLLHRSQDKNLYYVASFTFVPRRELAGHHMDFVKNTGAIEDIVNDYMSFVERFSVYFSRNNCKDQLILDPAFGFSKSYEENFELLNAFIHHPKFFRFNFYHAKSLMIGLSKKSFLRRYVIENDLVEKSGTEILAMDDQRVFEASEKLHASYLNELAQTFSSFSVSLKENQLLFLRTHAYFAIEL